MAWTSPLESKAPPQAPKASERRSRAATEKHKLLCPRCAGNSEVIDSRVHADGRMIRRRRRCMNNHRFTTIEVSMEAPPETGDLGFSAMLTRWANKLTARRLRKLAEQIENDRTPGSQIE